MDTILKLFLLITVGWLAVSCNSCPPETEPNFGLEIYTSDSLKLRTIKALGTINDFRLNRMGNDQYFRQSWYFSLPLSLNADSVTYILDFETRIDTLTVFYNRRFFYQDDCGFVLDIESPKGIMARTTFKDVQVSYESYIPKTRGGIMGNPEIIGLQVRAQL